MGHRATVGIYVGWVFSGTEERDWVTLPMLFLLASSRNIPHPLVTEQQNKIFALKGFTCMHAADPSVLRINELLDADSLHHSH
jgi:hypothetical protein